MWGEAMGVLLVAVLPTTQLTGALGQPSKVTSATQHQPIASIRITQRIPQADFGRLAAIREGCMIRSPVFSAHCGGMSQEGQAGQVPRREELRGVSGGTCDAQSGGERQRTQDGSRDDESPDSICERIQEVHELPQKGGSTEDPVLRAVLTAGVAVVPCLIDRISDGEAMHDPRPGGREARFAVGDLALLLVARIGGVSPCALLPTSVPCAGEDLSTDYFDWVAKPVSRLVLEEHVRIWWATLQRRRWEQRGVRDRGRVVSFPRTHDAE